jgi:hypothetical protein
VPVLPAEILTLLVVSIYVIYLYFLLASPHNHRKDMISLMDLMEAEHMYKNFDTNLCGSFQEHKELLKEKDQRFQDTQDNETVYSFTLCHLLKNVELEKKWGKRNREREIVRERNGEREMRREMGEKEGAKEGRK